mmetsp:Transcript_3924/g.10826  ORF Transcript_3924/g.10826 Transcript_3924/m.10826 type:complete len:296 (-) Transcript_3924:49-936(-)
MKLGLAVGFLSISIACRKDVRASAGNGTRNGKRIAIIGGGVSGSFAAKYLADYDEGCSLDAVDLYEPSPISDFEQGKQHGIPSSGEPESDDDWQGSRVSSLTLHDGTVVELGASIIFDGNKLVVDMIKEDPDLVMGRPMTPGAEKETALHGQASKHGFGIYGGTGEWMMTSSDPRSWVRTLKLLWRYNLDLIKMDRVASRALKSFDLIYELLASTHPASFLQSADELWDAVGLLNPAKISFDAFLDAIGVCNEVQWWRKLLPQQGCIRSELLTAANINNYNQNNEEMNGKSTIPS